MIEGSPPPNVPDWLDVSRLPPRPKEQREPWYYGFLEKYAQVLLGCSVLLFAGFALVVFFPDLAVSIFHVVRSSLEGASAADRTDAFSAIAARFLVRVVVIGFAFLVFLLPNVLMVAYLLLAVDAGRNLRTLRQRGSNP